MSLKAAMLYGTIKNKLPCKVKVKITEKGIKTFVVIDAYMKDTNSSIIYLECEDSSHIYPIHEKHIIEVCDYGES